MESREVVPLRTAENGLSQLGAARVVPESRYRTGLPRRVFAEAPELFVPNDMFVPKGYVPLTTAVDQLAEARRTAGQTNDDARNAARVELRGEFHSGSMLATVIHPGSGETFTIFPERWALEKALTWLEQGGCLLTSGLVYPRLGISFNKDPTVKIFVSEHDLQRLMAKQEVKQEAAPPPGPYEVSNDIPAATSGRGKQRTAVRVAFKTVFPSGSIPVGMSSQTRNDKIREELTNMGVKPLPDTRTIERALKGDG